MTHRLCLPPELTIYTVGELRPQWLQWLSAVREDTGVSETHDNTVEVDAAAVGEVDAAGVQLLMSLRHALRHEQRVLRLGHPSRALTDACGTLGAGVLLAGPASTGAAS
jgi:ABC-type transporter Mla MlaB component